jgi:hypothetical protein
MRRPSEYAAGELAGLVDRIAAAIAALLAGRRGRFIDLLPS